MMPNVSSIATKNLPKRGFLYSSRIVVDDGVFMEKDSNIPSGIELTCANKKIVMTISSSFTEKSPIEIVHIITEKKESSDQIDIIYQTSARANIVQHIIQKEASSHVYRVDISMKMHKRSMGHFLTYIEGLDQGKYRSSFVADLDQDSFLGVMDLSIGENNIEQNITSHLKEEGSFICMQGLHYMQGNGTLKVSSAAHHHAKNTSSSLTYKNIVDDFSTAHFLGNVIIEKNAANCSSSQMNRNLVLSKKAQVKAQPSLEIYNEKVQATHGSTTSFLEQEALFYLQAKGFSLQEAQKILVKAFCQEILKCVKVKEISESVMKRLN